jgi:hypothetical protein
MTQSACSAALIDDILNQDVAFFVHLSTGSPSWQPDRTSVSNPLFADLFTVIKATVLLRLVPVNSILEVAIKSST